ncbi:hypothetical protein CARUB_v10019298mg [Capsella rubella]|uniref:Prolamin-like domain-containing protein n=1 Tax=Capsella rubella TaxID=81985 RepID=R0HPQ2_9BRAS|nr:uncharacterized protein LOC17886160 [Capsella rubella]EOA25918.1 hypothetical protein CARUB_v10019298mg [Capsella rubella]
MAINTTTVTKSMAAAFFTIIAMAALASAATTGVVQPPESDHLVNRCMAKVSSRCAMYVTAEMYNHLHGPLKQNGCCLEVYHMGRVCLHIVTRHVIETLMPKLEGVEKQDSLEKSTQIWYLCVSV